MRLNKNGRGIEKVQKGTKRYKIVQKGAFYKIVWTFVFLEFMTF